MNFVFLQDIMTSFQSHPNSSTFMAKNILCTCKSDFFGTSLALPTLCNVNSWIQVIVLSLSHLLH